MRSSVAILLTALYCGPLQGQNTLESRIDAVVTQKMQQYDLPGVALGVVKEGQVIMARGYGVKTRGTDSKVTEKSVFHTASVSKLFTAQAVMHLVHSGKIALDDRMTELLKDLSYRDEGVEEITVRMLLNHTSGLPDVRDYDWGKEDHSDAVLGDYVSNLKLKLIADPGSEYHYSNLGYDILGHVISQVAGVPFETHLKTEILLPSGMGSSDFNYHQVPQELRVSPHSKNRISGQVFVRDTYPYNREHAPSSTLNASASDLSAWIISFLQALDTGAYKAVYREMMVPSTNTYSHIGLGFQVAQLESNQRIGHFGGDRGFRSYLMMLPEKEIGIVVLGNADYNEDFRQEIVHTIAKMMLE